MEGKFAHWSAENATKAYLNTLKMGMKRGKEPDESEFISAIAGGSNAKLIVVACAGTAAPSTVLALVAAAQQTQGRVVCIFSSLEDLESSKESIGLDMGYDFVDFVMGDAQRLILEDYKEADFVVIDCKLKDHQMILREMKSSGKCTKESVVVLGYNAFSTSSWQWAGLRRTQLLPIGDGLLFTQIGTAHQINGFARKSHWVVRVDKHTGEEHVFRVRCPF